jgi:hypothetical protein
MYNPEGLNEEKSRRERYVLKGNFGGSFNKM